MLVGENDYAGSASPICAEEGKSVLFASGASWIGLTVAACAVLALTGSSGSWSEQPGTRIHRHAPQTDTPDSLITNVGHDFTILHITFRSSDIFWVYKKIVPSWFSTTFR